jgi:CRISPR-associated protein Cmr1
MESEIVKKEHSRDDLRIETLTPLWTGDIQGNSPYVKETGIIGSLRWWYEALVRGLGGYACDITSADPRERCDYDRDKTRICAACKLFGCTGWRRRFRLEVIPQNNPQHPLFFITSSLKWWLETIFEYPSQVAFGKFGIDLYGKDEFLSSIKALFFFLSKYGGIGARNQYGFGQFKICDSAHEKEYEENWIKLTKMEFPSEKSRSSYQGDLPSIKNFFFLKCKIKEDSPLVIEFKEEFKRIKMIPEDFDWSYMPIAPDLRYKGVFGDGCRLGIRDYFREEEHIQGSDDEAIFGYVHGSKKNSSKINVSHLYKEDESAKNYLLKIWGILPEKCSYTPENFLEKVERAIPNEFKRIEKKNGRDILGDSQ